MPNSYQSERWTGPQIDQIYPVGSIYMSVNSTNPGTLFGGSWERIQDQFLLSAGSTYTAGTTGGAASVTSSGTALTTAQMPAHTHGRGTMNITGTILGRGHYTKGAYGGALVGASGAFSYARQGGSGTNTGVSEYNSTSGVTNDQVSFSASSSWTGETSSVGSGSAHTHTVSTMPPYLVVYMWQRVA